MMTNKKIVHAIICVLIGNFGAELTGASSLGCTPAQVQTVNTVATDAIDATEFACIMTSPLTTSPEVALACNIVADVSKVSSGLLSFIDTLITQRAAMQQNGFAFDKPSMKWAKKK